MSLIPYLDFNGCCEEAIEFYRKALGAEVTMLSRFKDSPDQSMIAPGSENKVMHSSLRIGDSTIMATDGSCLGKTTFEGIKLSITVPDLPSAERLFAALSEGGQVHMPLTKTFFSPGFGMLADRFGVPWMIHVGA